jgi:hypothetical protein
MTTRMLVCGAGSATGRKMLFSTALIISAVSAAAAASPSDLEQDAVCIPAAPSWLVPDQGLWGVNLAVSGFEASAQPIPYLAETLRWASVGTNGTAMGLFELRGAPALQHSELLGTATNPLTTPTLTSDLFDPTPLTPNPSGFAQGPLAQPLAGSLTPPPPATVGSGVTGDAPRP